MPIRILIADDHGVIRGGLRALLEEDPDMEVVGEAANGKDAIQLSVELLPDILLTDLGMPGMSGIEVTRQIKKECLMVRVLILTMYEDESLLREAISVGASGYIIKRALEEELINAIHIVMRGDLYVHPTMTRLLVKNLTPRNDHDTKNINALTPREKEVMSYIIRGFTNQQTAKELMISIRTVEGHRANLMGKLSLKNRVELIEFAENHNLKD